METVILEWGQLFLRWLHIITGIAWIGASFYFVWLNNHLRPPEKNTDGIDGDLWAIHGGGFYRVQRFAVAPEKLPKELHWFKWEAYMTWISGISLLILMFYFEARVYMIDPEVADLTVWQAIAIGVGAIVGGWIFYDLLQKSPVGKNQLLFGILFFAFTVAVSYGLSQTLSGRAAYIHVGAMLGSIMVANVFFNIIPNQRKVVDDMVAGRQPDQEAATSAKNRSLHNNYITLPVLFIMISNHYPFTFGHEWNWGILMGISVAGALIRHWFNLRGQGQKNYWLWPLAALGLLSLAFVTAPRSQGSDGKKLTYADVQPIIEKHCRGCHSSQPTDEVFKVAPSGVMYDTPEQVKAMAEKIKIRAINTKSMPQGNKTKMTQEERNLLGIWIDQGAKLD